MEITTAIAILGILGILLIAGLFKFARNVILTLIAFVCFASFLVAIVTTREDLFPTILFLGAGFIIPLLLWLFTTHNQLNKLRVRCERAWADIGVQLQRRHDLISRLVETVKAYAGHEHKTLQSVVEARSQAMVAQGPGEKAKAEGILTQTLAPLFGLVEAYPELRSTENFSQLQQSLNHIEESVGSTRTTYNSTVQELNTDIMTYPTKFVAGMLSFKPFEFFAATATESPTLDLQSLSEKSL